MAQTPSTPTLGTLPNREELARKLGANPGDLDVRIPEFADLSPANAGEPTGQGPGGIHHLLDVACTVTAELGRIKLSIGEVLKLNVGSVLELNRLISEPVDVLVQGVLLARGEVVVVNDRFAIRIKEIVDARKRS
jgi:flagellar motor switch protein FliN